MIRARLLHPEILRHLAAAGHGSTVLISDGNFPHATGPRPDAPRVYLNLAPDVLRVTDVLTVLLETIPVESAAVMVPQPTPDAPEPETPAAHAELLAVLGSDLVVERLPRQAFYVATRGDDLALVIATGDRRPYANVLLTIGVVTDPA